MVINHFKRPMSNLRNIYFVVEQRFVPICQAMTEALEVLRTSSL